VSQSHSAMVELVKEKRERKWALSKHAVKDLGKESLTLESNLQPSRRLSVLIGQGPVFCGDLGAKLPIV